ncbi:MAG: protein sphX, partial [Thermotogae bacterium]|nr:protein sphX [Thermotogota bacterium]
LAYYLENRDKLKAVPIDAGNGPVAPTVENVVAGKYVPLSRPLFIYVSKKAYDTKPYVRKFVHYYLDHVKDLVREVGYVELPDEAYALAKERIERGITGSVFGGEGAKVGVKITDLLKLELER